MKLEISSGWRQAGAEILLTDSCGKLAVIETSMNVLTGEPVLPVAVHYNASAIYNLTADKWVKLVEMSKYQWPSLADYLFMNNLTLTAIPKAAPFIIGRVVVGYINRATGFYCGMNPTTLSRSVQIIKALEKENTTQQT